MKKLLPILVIGVFFFCCTEEKKLTTYDPDIWLHRKVRNLPTDSLISGTTYLPVYSQIYSRSQDMMRNLTVTVSMRNTSDTDSIYILKTHFFDTHAIVETTYHDEPIFLIPLETVEIVIKEIDTAGGTGGNFLFDWKIKQGSSEPLFESIMISTMGQQGLSFTSRGKRIK